MIYILQGPPGSGKSTWAKKQNAVVVSADHFVALGQSLAEAHNSCIAEFVLLAIEGVNVIVDNTNTTAMEICPYFAVGRAFGHEITIVRFPGRGPGKDVHNVPEDVYHRMVRNIKDCKFPPYWVFHKATPDSVGVR